MIRSAVIIFLVNYCAFLVGQDLHFSKIFDSPKKNLAVQIINTHSSYFYVLRQNKAVHDITIERRAKPNAEILNFTPLKLDSVNNVWFDYENLDYITFEVNTKLCFLFEKVLNTKKTLYLKIIDTTGRSTGFIELANLESDRNTEDFYFSYTPTTNGDILIVATKIAIGGITRKVAMLYSVKKREWVWMKKIPLENDINSTYSYSCDNNGELYYFQSLYSIIGTETYNGFTRRITRFDSLLLWRWKPDAKAPGEIQLNVSGLDHMQQTSVVADTHSVFISIKGLLDDTLTRHSKELFRNIMLDYNSGKELLNTTTFYEESIREQLTFYDGPDDKESYHKQHFILNTYTHGDFMYTLSERAGLNYYKELLFRKTNLRTGAVVSQKIIPRKIFFFPNRTRYKNVAEPMVCHYQGSLTVLLMENAGNLKRNAANYHYKSFKRASGPGGANIVAYTLKSTGDFEKKLIYKNEGFELIPLKYYSESQKDMILYFNSDGSEKFAILKLNP
ncbi:hypothetical protein CNR22_09995 [Sphingobacteriaceae bacterium]|nr:hypothetical protein CNR22_09995 [Sphingobacteriaceae bacterium]